MEATAPTELREFHLQVPDELVSDIENLALGVFAPLKSFLCQNDYLSVLADMRMSDDTPYPIPIIMDVDQDELKGHGAGDEVVLAAENNAAIATLKIEEVYRFDKKEHALRVFSTDDPSHPGVAKTLGMKSLLVGGELHLLKSAPNRFERYSLAPFETKLLFQEKGWRTVVGFQTRNVPHLGHEYLQKTALSFVDGIFINPVIGRKKQGDFKDEVILEAYDALVQNYYLRQRAVLAIFRTEMRYAGPREAVFHAIVRRNFGCTHFLIGRDHAGVGKFYPPYAAQEIFQQFPDLGIIPLFFTSFFYCKRCASVANEKTCPHGSTHRIDFSGTQMRDYFARGQMPPPEMIRPEVAEIIMRHPSPFVGEPQ